MAPSGGQRAGERLVAMAPRRRRALWPPGPWRDGGRICSPLGRDKRGEVGPKRPIWAAARGCAGRLPGRSHACVRKTIKRARFERMRVLKTTYEGRPSRPRPRSCVFAPVTRAHRGVPRQSRVMRRSPIQRVQLVEPERSNVPARPISLRQRSQSLACLGTSNSVRPVRSPCIVGEQGVAAQPDRRLSPQR